MKAITLSWDANKTPSELRSILRALGESYPIVEGPAKGAITLTFERGAVRSGLTINLAGGSARIGYDKPCHATRAVGTLLSGTVKAGVEYAESMSFETFGIMLDCSRNAVMTVEHFQKWLRQLALMGYNMAMLYTEDTYELPGEEWFGYLRGRYTAEELKTIDRYGAALGIEMIGCIQTLGHLEQILKWPAYGKVRDTSSVLMVDEPATYELIDKMIAACTSSFASRRVHIGMDETHDLGRGRFMDLLGYQRGYDIFNRHLAKVIEICQRHGLSPMIWSDMYFRMGSKSQGYYDLDCSIPDDVKAAIPKAAQLVYWDYYHDNEAFYLDWIGRHRALGFEPVMASGVWTWGTVWYNRQTTEKMIAPCVQACRKAGVKEFLFTLWGDDGGYCEFDSALAGLLLGADLAYAAPAAPAALQKRFAAICGGDYKLVTGAAAVNLSPAQAQGLLWDDALLQTFWKVRRTANAKFWPLATKSFARVLKGLGKAASVTEPVDLAHAATVARFLLAKIELFAAVDKAYASRNKPALRKAAGQAKALVKRLDALLESFRRQWYRRNKPEGFDTMQIRLGGQKERLGELARRLTDLAAGRVACIPELDQAPRTGDVRTGWRNLAAAGIL